MRKNMSWIKRNVELIYVLFQNIIVAFAFLGLLLLTPPTVYHFYNFLKNIGLGATIYDERADLEIYNSYPWAKKHFEEFHIQSFSYHNYIVYRRDDFQGETINVKDGFRETTLPEEVTSDEEVWFFGGSTTWGDGNDTAHTYPSLFAQRNSMKARNFGEAGYISRQSLALLQNQYILENGGGNKIVFYDGLNDVGTRCAIGVSGLATRRQEQIRQKLALDQFDKYGFKRTFRQLIDFIRVTNGGSTAIEKFSGHDCHVNTAKAEYIAKTLVAIWVQAQAAAHVQNDEFVAILQPVAVFRNPIIDYLDDTLDDNSRAQYDAVYPLIIKYASEENLNFIDLTKTYDNCSNCYIDFAHAGPQGHEILVTALTDVLLKP